MRQFKNFIITLITLIFLASCPAFANSQNIREAEVFIDKFQKSSHSYDENLTDMYADNAVIIRILEHENGETEKVILPTNKYKKFLKYVKIFAKIKGYKNHYTNLEYRAEGENVRVNGQRKTSDGYMSPISMLVGKNKNGEWKIFEESTSTKAIFLVNKILTKN